MYHTTLLKYVKIVIELHLKMKAPKGVGAIVGANDDTVRKVPKENEIYIQKFSKR